MDIVNMMGDDTMQLDAETIHKFESLLDTQLIRDNITMVTLEPYKGEKYKGNLYGLLHNEFNIPNFAIYLIIRINGFKSSLTYDGRLNLMILNPETVETIISNIKDI